MSTRENTVAAMMKNHQASSWGDVQSTDDSDTPLYDDTRASAHERLDAYVDYCFETYPVLARTLHRDQIDTAVVDWDRRRGYAMPRTHLTRKTFGKRLTSKHRVCTGSRHSIAIATALVGTPPSDDGGVGWKACVRHELGHCIDYAQRGESDHGPKFKSIMRQFGEDTNDGRSTHGYAPEVHRSK